MAAEVLRGGEGDVAVSGMQSSLKAENARLRAQVEQLRRKLQGASVHSDGEAFGPGAGSE